MTTPIPTPIYRLVHVDNLTVLLRRKALHAPNHTPADGLQYRTIHDEDVQAKRHERKIPCGPGGVIHDYVGFYFGPLSPMHFRLKTGRVHGYDEGQDPLIYLTSTAQAVERAGIGFAFSDGHGIAAYTSWYGDLADLDNVDWDTVAERYWRDTADDMDRQRRKQAEFAIYQTCPWTLIDEIAVVNDDMRTRVLALLGEEDRDHRKPVNVRPDWYYY